MNAFYHLLKKYRFKITVSSSLIIVFFFFFPLLNVYSLSIEDLEKKIEKERNDLIRLNERMKEQKLNISKSRSKERSILSELEEMDHQIKIKQKELNIYNWNLKVNHEKKKFIHQRLKETERNIERQKSLLSNRFRTIYKQGDLSYLRVVFSASNLNDFMERYKFMYLIAKHDAKLISDFKQNLKDLKKAKDELEKTDSRISLYQNKTLKKKKEINTKKKKKELLLVKIRDEKITYEITHQELEKAARELDELIKDLEKRKITLNKIEEQNKLKSLGGLLHKKRKLHWPVKGIIISEFGEVKDLKFKIPIFNKGIEIKAPFGTNIKSIDSGRIIFADWLKGYGNLVIIDHGDNYYSLYAHNSEFLVEKGERVSPDQIIAKLGDSGSLKGPLLYFEIRHFWKPLNPLIWLKKD